MDNRCDLQESSKLNDQGDGDSTSHCHSHSDDNKDLDEDNEESAGANNNNATDLLPSVPPILVHLQPHHQTLHIGRISSIRGKEVIVESSLEHNPLNEGSILWLTHTRTPLGLINKTFGLVKGQFYSIRYNSRDDLPPAISVGTPVSFVPEFATFALSTNKDGYQKGYDIADNEISDKVKFFDGEKDAKYKSSILQAKRAAKNNECKQPAPVNKNRTNVKNDGNFPSPSPSQLPHPIAHSQQNQQGLFSQNQLPPNQFQLNQLPQNQFQQNQFAQNQFPQAHMPQYQLPQYQFPQAHMPQYQFAQNQFPQAHMPQYQLPQNQFQQNQFVQNQFPQAHMPQYQLPQSQILENQLPFNMSMLAAEMQIPNLGLAMNTNQCPFMSTGINFPPSTMQLNPGIFPSGEARPPMQGNPSIPNPANASSSGEQPVAPMQFHPGNVSTGGQGQFSPGQSFPFPLPFPGLFSNSNRGESPNQGGRGGRHPAGRTGNVRP